MKTNFCDIIIDVLDREGGYVDDPDDRGGETYKGIARNHHPDWEGWTIIDEYKGHDNFPNVLEDSNDLQGLVFMFYRRTFWEPSKACKLPREHREHYFDMCVNHGQKRAVLILQQAINSRGYNIAIDGLIGPQTIKHSSYVDLKDVVYERIYFYSEIIYRNSSQMKFRKGWYNRALSFLTI